MTHTHTYTYCNDTNEREIIPITNLLEREREKERERRRRVVACWIFEWIVETKWLTHFRERENQRKSNSGVFCRRTISRLARDDVFFQSTTPGETQPTLLRRKNER